MYNQDSSNEDYLWQVSNLLVAFSLKFENQPVELSNVDYESDERWPREALLIKYIPQVTEAFGKLVKKARGKGKISSEGIINDEMDKVLVEFEEKHQDIFASLFFEFIANGYMPKGAKIKEDIDMAEFAKFFENNLKRADMLPNAPSNVKKTKEDIVEG